MTKRITTIIFAFIIAILLITRLTNTWSPYLIGTLGLTMFILFARQSYQDSLTDDLKNEDEK